jgi:hypothetical protein
MTTEEIVDELSKNGWRLGECTTKTNGGETVYSVSFIHPDISVLAGGSGRSPQVAHSEAYNLARKLARSRGLSWVSR